MKNPTDQIDYDEKSDRKEVSRSMKKLFNQEAVMLMVLCVVVVAVMFGATVAWFVGQSPATVSNMELTLDDKGDLYVWVKVENPGEDEVTDEDFAKILGTYTSEEEGDTSAATEAETTSEGESDTTEPGEEETESSTTETVEGESESDTTETGEGESESSTAEPGEGESESGTVEPGEGENGTTQSLGETSEGEGESTQNDSETSTTAQEETTTASITKKSGYVPIQSIGIKKSGSEDYRKYSMNLNIVKLENIEQGKFAPGSYGKVEFRILSKTSLTKGYKLMITPSIDISEADMQKLKKAKNFASEEEAKQYLLDIVKSHIKFYAKKTTDENKNIYSEVILYDEECAFNYHDSTYPSVGITVDNSEENMLIYGERVTKEGMAPEHYFRFGMKKYIEENRIETLELYWYWPYEYTDIPACLEKDNSDSVFYEEYKKYTDLKTPDKTDAVTKAEQIEAYDRDDTYIGNYISELMFHFDIEAVR